MKYNIRIVPGAKLAIIFHSALWLDKNIVNVT